MQIVRFWIKVRDIADIARLLYMLSSSSKKYPYVFLEQCSKEISRIVTLVAYPKLMHPSLLLIFLYTDIKRHYELEKRGYLRYLAAPREMLSVRKNIDALGYYIPIIKSKRSLRLFIMDFSDKKTVVNPKKTSQINIEVLKLPFIEHMRLLIEKFEYDRVVYKLEQANETFLFSFVEKTSPSGSPVQILVSNTNKELKTPFITLNQYGEIITCRGEEHSKFTYIALINVVKIPEELRTLLMSYSTSF
ncbi:MAG: hypothetical protein ACTSX9_00550 [Candidatus Njordarchaeales archaeon]